MFTISRSLVMLTIFSGLTACEQTANTVVCWEEPIPDARRLGGVGYNGITNDKYALPGQTRTICAPINSRLPVQQVVNAGSSGARPTPGVVPPNSPPPRSTRPQIALNDERGSLAADGDKFALTGDGSDLPFVLAVDGNQSASIDLAAGIRDEVAANLGLNP